MPQISTTDFMLVDQKKVGSLGKSDKNSISNTHLVDLNTFKDLLDILHIYFSGIGETLQQITKYLK